jgi:hypothetical protein
LRHLAIWEAPASVRNRRPKRDSFRLQQQHRGKIFLLVVVVVVVGRWLWWSWDCAGSGGAEVGRLAPRNSNNHQCRTPQVRPAFDYQLTISHKTHMNGHTAVLRLLLAGRRRENASSVTLLLCAPMCRVRRQGHLIERACRHIAHAIVEVVEVVVAAVVFFL